jgi:hypothetical protein
VSIYGSVLYGSAVYGSAPPAGSPLANRRAILGSWAPWLPGNVIPWRKKCTQFYSVDPTTLAWSTTPLPYVTNGCARAIDTRDNIIAQDTLSIQVADAAGVYLPGGALASALAPNALVGVEVTVTTPAGTLSYRPNIYRVTTGLSQDTDRWGRTVFNTSALDWVHAALDQLFPPPPGTPTIWGPIPDTYTWEGGTLPVLSGISGLNTAFGLLNWALAAPGPAVPIVGGVTYSYGTLAAAMWNLFSDGRMTVDPSVPAGYALPQGIMWTKYWTDPLLPKYGSVTWRDLLGWLGINLPLRVVYADGGDLVMFGGVERRDSGYVVSCDPVYGGDFPVPWESAKRAVTRTPFSATSTWYSWLSPDHPPVPYLIRVAQAISRAARNPHVAPIAKSENVVAAFATPDALPNSVGGDTVGDVTARRLRDYLGGADVLTLQTDSACPPPMAGDEVLVYLPEDKIIGWWAFTGATIPCSVQPASWTLQWRDDDPGAPRSG